MGARPLGGGDGGEEAGLYPKYVPSTIFNTQEGTGALSASKIVPANRP